MIDSRKHRWALGIFGLAGLFLLAVYVLPGFVDKSDGQARHRTVASPRHSKEQCTEQRQVPVEHGDRDSQRWSVVASIENDHDCGAWLLGMNFRPKGIERASWKGFWEIPAGGHLPDTATIAAQDEATGEARVVSGVVGWRVRTVAFRTKSGRKFVVHPKAPGLALRRRYVWLQNLRYFLRFYRVGDPVRTARLIDSHGHTLRIFRCRLGEIEGRMSL